MMIQLVKNYSIILVTCLLVISNVFAGDLPFHSRISYGANGGTIVEIGNPEASSSIAVTPGVGAYSDLNIRSFISLGIDHDLPEYLGLAFDLEVDIEVVPSLSNTSLATFTKTLKVGYHPFDKESYTDKDIYKFTGNDAFDYTITGIRLITGGVTTSITELPKNVYIDGDILVNRVGNFTSESDKVIATNSAPVLLDLDCDSNVTPDAVRISWGTIGTAVEYQLEWTFVNNYNGEQTNGTFGLLPPDSLNYNFRSNSTRITTTSTYYDIPLVFESGYLMWRIRAVGYNPLNLNRSVFGVWTNGLNEGNVLAFTQANTNNYILNLSPHEVNKNWQLTTTFAEEGKKKEVISYYDGSLRNRQSVTVVNTDDNVIVGETIYDYQGRPAINVLPVPVKRIGCSDTSKTYEPVIKYYPNFNRNNGDSAYSRLQFDIDQGSCLTGAEKMSKSDGASNYYSDLNPNKEAHQAFVPEANGRPFTQVEYTPDNTGRVRRQSGVGEDFQLDSDHETEYYYGKALQLNLDRLFASEVGYAAHYKKNLVVDPNGQVNISYLDQEGRVVATALAGEAPDNLSAIQSLEVLNASEGVDLSVDLFEKDANNKSRNNLLNATGDALEFSHELIVSTAGYYRLKYDLSVDAYTDTCTPNLCYNCVYDLNLSLTDECGNIVIDTITGESILFNVQEGFFIKDSSGDFSTFTTVCNNGNTYESSVYDVVANLNVGNYTITKTLTLNNRVVSEAFKAYLREGENSGCIDSLGSFKAEALANLDLSGCNISCDSCEANLGTLDDFVSKGKGSAETYEALLKECKGPCTQPTYCETIFEILKEDVSPGGQYGGYLINGNQGASGIPLSVYNPNNVLPFNSFNVGAQNNWRNPEVTINGVTYDYYLDEDNDSAKVYITVIGTGSSAVTTPAVLSVTTDIFYDASLGLFYTYPDRLAIVYDFINEFETSWAQSLVKYHPEYCYYETCIGFEEKDTNEVSSESFDALLRTTTTFQEAINRGLIVLNGSNYEVVDFTNPSSAHYDPFITTGNYGANGASLSTLFNTYQTISGTPFSMQEFAGVMARCNSGSQPVSTLTACGNAFGDATGGVNAVNDNEWNAFVSLYLGKKKELQNNYADEQAILEDNCLNDCIGENNYSPFGSGMFQIGGANPYYNQANGCSIYKKGLYASKTKRFSDTDDLSSQTTANNVGYQSYIQTGNCPKVTYVQELLNNLATNQNLTSSSTDLSVYPIYGAIYDNELPLASRNWVSTIASGEIEASIQNQFTNESCEFTINSNGQISNWNDVVSFSGLKSNGYNSTSSLYEFEAIVKLVSGQFVPVTGVTCLDLVNCTFENECKPNDLANSVESVLNLITGDNQLISNSYNLPSNSVYQVSANTQFLNQLNTNSVGNITWSFNSGGTQTSTGTFTNGTTELNILFKGTTTGASFTNYASIAYFANINSNYQYFFTLDAYDASGTLLATLKCEALRSTVGSNQQFGVSMGDCKLPTPIACSQDEYLILDDLKDLLSDALLTNNYNVFQSTNMTSLLQSYLNGGTSSTGTISTVNGKELLSILIKDDPTSNQGVCSIDLSFDSQNSIDYTSIIAVNEIKAVGPLTNNAFASFELSVTIQNGIEPAQEMIINGTSCLPLLNCELCDSTTVEPMMSPQQMIAMGMGQSSGMVDEQRCNTLYEEYLVARNIFFNNQNIPGNIREACFELVPIATPQEFIDSNLCCSENGFTALEAHINAFLNDTVCPGVLPFIENCNEPTDTSKDCQNKYEGYISAITNYNNYVDSSSLSWPLVTIELNASEFTNDKFCNCADGYIAYLNSKVSGVNQVTPTEDDVNIQSYCPKASCVSGGGFILDTIEPLTINDSIDPCEEQARNIALLNAEIAYQQLVNNLATAFVDSMKNHCLQVEENFTMDFNEKEYHYTLYYYDQAGNLVKTVPPEGVELVNTTSSFDDVSTNIKTDRQNVSQSVFTFHRLETKYKYNSLNQLTHQCLPDHDKINICEYTAINGLDKNLTVNAVQFVTETKAYLTGYVNYNNQVRGITYTSNDGGQTWQKLEGTLGSDLKAVEWLDNNTAYAVGTSGILIRTVDGGFTWDIIDTYSANITSQLNGIELDGSGSLVAVGNNGTIIKITGNTVSVINPIVSGSNFAINNTTNITSINDVRGALTITVEHLNANNETYGLAYASFDNGVNWTPLSTIKVASLTSVSAINDLNYVAVGPKGTFIKSFDGGDNWYQQAVEVKQDFKAVYFSSINDGIAIRENGFIHATQNGGATWTVIDNTNQYNGLYAYEPTKVLVYGDNGTVGRVILNAGTSFGVVNHATSFTGDLTTGWAGEVNNIPTIIVSSGNNVLHITSNANTANPTWIDKVTSITNIQNIEGANFNGAIRGVLSNTNGALFGYEYANATLVVTPIIGTTNFNSLGKNTQTNDFVSVNNTTGEIVSMNGSVSAPNSITTQLATSLSEPINSITSKPSGNGFIIGGSNGTIANVNITTGLYSVNDQTNNIRTLPLNDIAAVEAGKVFIGENGTILKSAGLASCELVPTDDATDYNKVSGQDAMEGVIVGDQGMVYKVNDQGVLTKIITSTTNDITALAIDYNTNMGYYGGANGQLYHTPNINVTTPLFNGINTNSTQKINEIKVSPSGRVLYVGDKSSIFRGSQNMAYEIKSVYTPKLVDVNFSSSQNGYVIGDNYTARHTTNGGLTWSTVLPDVGFVSGTVPVLNAVFATGINTAQLVGNTKYVAKVMNDLATEAGINTPIGAYPLHDISYTNSLNGAIVGGDATQGQVWLTTDGGINWNASTVPAGVSKLRALHAFTRNNTFVAVGNDESMVYIKSLNNIEDITSNLTSNEDLYDVHFYDDITGYAVGTNGTLLKSSNGSINQATGLLTNLIWSKKETSDAINLNPKDIYAADFTNKFAGFLGGLHTGKTTSNYARILRDESGEFSTYFWYDRLGRIVVSQNSKQFSSDVKRYSYTLYDVLGRVIEAGEKEENTALLHKSIFGTYVSGLYNPSTVDDTKLNTWLNDVTGNRIEVTKSYYDLPIVDLGIAGPNDFTQNKLNMRKRISAITYEKVFDYGASSINTYDYGTFYDYDIHGNVKTLIQDNKALSFNSNPSVAALQYKRLDYHYDLISGNVHQVDYQKGKADAWHHRYTYDADNRIETTETSKDEFNWDREANYIYYDHGPLARVEVGEHNVQGTDYIYTLQGWLKGVNSDLLNTANDPGKDGVNVAGNPNGLFAKDAMGFSLRYRANDYSPIDYANKWQNEQTRFASVFNPISNQGTSDVLEAKNNLYNGNIGGMVTTITKPQLYTSSGNEVAEVLPQATAYLYDQLNRISKARAYQNVETNVASLSYNTWQTSGNAYDNLYYNAFKYDASGNILTQERHDNFGNKIEDLVYHYGDDNGKRLQNRLYSVSDFATPINEKMYGDDIEDMGFTNAPYELLNNGNENYKYDQIGQLVQNKQEDIKEIVWRVDNKVKAIIKELGSKARHIIFDYDPMGNRIAKHVYANNGAFDVNNPTNWEKTTYYRRDAQGNPMATYEYYLDTVTQTTSFKLIERNIYGSSRIGMNRDSVEMISAIPFDPTSFKHKLGAKQYECTNHLGNVLAVVTDRKFARDTNQDGLIDCYVPEIVKATDYSPFGVELYGRNFVRDSIIHQIRIEQDSVIEFEKFILASNGGIYAKKDQALNFTHPFGTGEVTKKERYILKSKFNADFNTNKLEATKTWIVETGDIYEVSFDVIKIDSPIEINGSNTISTTGVKTFTFLATSNTLSVSFTGENAINGFKVEIDDLALTKKFELSESIASLKSQYRYGFQGQEHDEEVLDYHYRYTAFDSIQDTTVLNTLSLNGTNAEINLGNDARSISNQLTISTWIRTTDNGNQATYIAHDYNNQNGYQLVLKGGKVAINGANQGQARGSGLSQAIADGDWHFVTGVVTSQDDWLVYVDGFLSNSTSYTSASVDVTNTEDLIIGNHTGNNSRHYEGDIRDVAIWNTAKDANEVLVDFTQEHPQGTELNLVGYYPLTEGAGTTANDLSVSNNTGTIANEDWSTYETYKMVIKPYYDTTVSNYLSFDGVNDYVDATNNNRNLSDNVTVEAWIRTTEIGDFNTQPDIVVSDYRTQGFQLVLRAGRISMEGRNGSDNIYKQATSAQVVADGNWHHVVGVADMNDVWHVYVDGQCANVADYVIPNPNFANNDKLLIGRRFDGRFPFKGDIRDVSVWNKAKGAHEVFYDFKRAHPTGNEAGLVGYFPLKEGSGNTANDLSPTGINGTIFGATWDSELLIDSSYLAMDSTRLENRNSTTTFYRGYSPRVGRWYSIDPITKPNYSPYVSFRNSPMIYIDPRGDDDIFSSTGKFLFSTSKGNKILVANDGVVKRDLINNQERITAQTKVITDLTYNETSKSNIKMLKKVMLHYYKDAGIKVKRRGLKLLVKQKPEGSHRMAAYSRTNNTIEVSTNKEGKISATLQNTYAMKNTLVHEAYHGLDAKPTTLSHVSYVITGQINHDSWEGTTNEFKYGILGYTVLLLNKHLEAGGDVMSALKVKNKIEETGKLPGLITFIPEANKFTYTQTVILKDLVISGGGGGKRTKKKRRKRKNKIKLK